MSRAARGKALTLEKVRVFAMRGTREGGSLLKKKGNYIRVTPRTYLVERLDALARAARRGAPVNDAQRARVVEALAKKSVRFTTLKALLCMSFSQSTGWRFQAGVKLAPHRPTVLFASVRSARSSALPPVTC